MYLHLFILGLLGLYEDETCYGFVHTLINVEILVWVIL